MQTPDSTTEVVPQYRLEDSIHFMVKRMEAVEHNRPANEKPHRHAFYTVIWVEEGQGTHTIDFTDYEVSRAKIYFLSPEQVHFMKLESPPKGWVLEFNADFLAGQGIPLRYLTDLQLFGHCEEVSHWRVEESVGNVWRPQFHRMEQEQAEKAVFWQDRMGALLKGWLIDAHRSRQQQWELPTGPETAGGRLVREYKALIEHHYRSWHKVSEYADALAVTAGHLSDTIKTEIHASAKQIILDRILLEAQRMARFTEHSVKQTAHALGFDDPSHFAKTFKKGVGVSYLTFRESGK